MIPGELPPTRALFDLISIFLLVDNVFVPPEILSFLKINFIEIAVIYS